MTELERKRLFHMSLLFFLLLIVFLFTILRVKTFNVIGNEKYSDEEIEDILFPGYWDKNTCLLFLRERFKPHRDIPFITRYDITFSNPVNCEVIVYEKDTVGYFTYMSEKMYFDREGTVIEVSEEAIEGVPEIRGLSFGEVSLYRPIAVKDRKVFTNLVNLTGQLKEAGIKADTIIYNDLLEVNIEIGDIRASLGTDANIEQKIWELKSILPKIENMKGRLDLSGFDPSDENRSFIFIREK